MTSAIVVADQPQTRSWVRTKDGGYTDRVRVGGGKRPYFTIHFSAPPKSTDVDDRFSRLRVMASKLVASGKADAAPKLIADAAKVAGDRKALAGFERAVSDLCANKGKLAKPLTMRELCEQYTTGELHRRFPRDVDKRGKTDETRENERRRLALLCNHKDDKGRAFGEIAVADVTKADCDRSMLAVPTGASNGWRRAHAQPLQHVLDIACLQLGLLDNNPLPRKWSGSGNEQTLTAILYPDEEAILAACRKVLLDDRVMWGVQVREGFRPGGIRELRREHVDLVKGTVRHKHKTKRWRRWTLEPDVARVLRWWFEERPDPEFVFPHVARGPSRGEADSFREALLAAGITRAELHCEAGDGVRPIRAHDLRTTFVTVAFAHGRSEGWISAKTGHTTSAQLSRYKRFADSLEALDLGWFAPLDEVLGLVQGVAQKREIPEETGPSKRGACSSGGASRRVLVSKTPGKSTTPRLSAPRELGQAGVGGPNPDPGPDDDGGTPAAVPALPEDALRDLLALATRADRWDLVQALGGQLEAIARSRDAGKVTSLDRARRKRGGR